MGESTTNAPAPTDIEILTFNYDDEDHVHAVSGVNRNNTDYNYVYDTNGNMTLVTDLSNPELPERTISWNADNMVTQILSSAGKVDFVYDGEDKRAKKSVENGPVTYYVGNYFEEQAGVPVRHIFAGNLRIATLKGGYAWYYHNDHLGSSVAMTDASGTKIQTAEYLPYGGMREETGYDVTKYKFTDQELDAETGLYNYVARLYDPVIGRFISADSIVTNPFDFRSVDRYAYCRNNPLIYVDPSGHYDLDGGYGYGFWGGWSGHGDGGSDSGSSKGDWSAFPEFNRNGYDPPSDYGYEVAPDKPADASNSSPVVEKSISKAPSGYPQFRSPCIDIEPTHCFLSAWLSSRNKPDPKSPAINIPGPFSEENIAYTKSALNDMIDRYGVRDIETGVKVGVGVPALALSIEFAVAIGQYAFWSAQLAASTPQGQAVINELMPSISPGQPPSPTWYGLEGYAIGETLGLSER